MKKQELMNEITTLLDNFYEETGIIITRIDVEWFITNSSGIGGDSFKKVLGTKVQAQ